MKRPAHFLSAVFLFGAFFGAMSASAQSGAASADIVSATDLSVTLGTATLLELDGGGVGVRFDIGPNDVIAGGEHAIHIHETGSCEAADTDNDGTEEAAGAAGGHYNPTDVGHGDDNGPHVGDSENYNYAFNDDGSFSGEVVFPQASLSGDNPLLKEGGTAVMIHEGTDDRVTDPDGDAGSRVACGVIMARDAGETGGASTPQPTTVTGNAFNPEKVDATQDRIDALQLPKGFSIGVFASGFTRPRMLAQSEDSTVYVTLEASNEVAILRDSDGDGVADEQRVQGDFGDANLLHGIEIDGDTVYLASEKTVWKGTLGADGTIENLSPLVENLPDGDQHSHRTIALGPDGMLYVDLGSSCNACTETNPENATILRFNPDGSGREIFASGLRNTEGFDWHPVTAEMWGADHGIDWRGDDTPPEEVNRLAQGNDYGWPYCYGDRQANTAIPYPPPQGYDTLEAYCQNATVGVELGYQAHSAPINLKFYDADMFPEAFRNDAFVTMRGSWNRYPATGYKVVRLDFDDDGKLTGAEDFITGWLLEDGNAQFGRVAGLLVMNDGSLLISEDTNGIIYRVTYEDN